MKKYAHAASPHSLPHYHKSVIVHSSTRSEPEDSMKLDIRDINEANDALIKNGVPSRAELYARNEFTVLGVKVNLLPDISEETFSITSDTINQDNGPKAKPQ
jgi:hypothetical protein